MSNQNFNLIQSRSCMYNKLYQDKWDLRYECLVKFGDDHGHCNVPQKYIVTLPNNNQTLAQEDKAIHLGKWLALQRTEKRHGKLSSARFLRLQLLVDEGKLDWEPNNADALKWEMKFNALLKYATENGNCRISKSQQFILKDGTTTQLYHWLNGELSLYRKGKLREDRVRLFSVHLINPGYLEINSKFNADEFNWEKKYQALLKYGAENSGNYNVPDKYEYLDEDGVVVKLGSWLQYQRGERRRKKLREDREEKLNVLVSHGFLWDVKSDSYSGADTAIGSWNLKYELLLRYYNENDTCNVPDSYRVYNSDGKVIRLGRWLGKQRSLKKCGKLRLDRLNKLQDLVDNNKLLWELSSYEFLAQTWEEKFSLLVAYGNINGSCELPKNAIIISTNDKGESKEVKLGYWLFLQKTCRKNNKLKSDREMKLQLLVDAKKLSWDLNIHIPPMQLNSTAFENSDARYSDVEFDGLYQQVNNQMEHSRSEGFENRLSNQHSDNSTIQGVDFPQRFAKVESIDSDQHELLVSTSQEHFQDNDEVPVVVQSGSAENHLSQLNVEQHLGVTHHLMGYSGNSIFTFISPYELNHNRSFNFANKTDLLTHRCRQISDDSIEYRNLKEINNHDYCLDSSNDCNIPPNQSDIIPLPSRNAHQEELQQQYQDTIGIEMYRTLQYHLADDDEMGDVDELAQDEEDEDDDENEDEEYLLENYVGNAKSVKPLVSSRSEVASGFSKQISDPKTNFVLSTTTVSSASLKSHEKHFNLESDARNEYNDDHLFNIEEVSDYKNENNQFSSCDQRRHKTLDKSLTTSSTSFTTSNLKHCRLDNKRKILEANRATN